MPIKERLIELIQSQGYDVLTACKLADEIIKEVKQDKRKKITYYIGNIQFTIKKKG